MKLAKLSDVKIRLDGWINALSGLGVRGKDKRMSAEAEWCPMKEVELDSLYSGSDVAGKIVDIVPEECLRKGFEVTDVSERKIVDDKMKQTGFLEAFQRAWVVARQTGGSLLVAITRGGKSLDAPFSPNEEVIGWQVLSRFEALPSYSDLELNFNSPNFGKPRRYQISVPLGGSTNTLGQYVDASRCIRFDGTWLPRRNYVKNNYWHDSVLNKPFNAIRNYESTHDSVAAMIQDFDVNVFKLKNLAEMMAAGQEDGIRNRVEIAAYSKSVIRAVVMDQDETYENKSRNVAGLPELVTKVEKRLSASTNIPHTIILGESPEGSNSTGNSTTQGWYAYLNTQQVSNAEPKIRTGMEMMGIKNAKTLEMTWVPLYQLDEKEQAELRKSQAQTDEIYITNQVLTSEEVALSRFGGEKYSTETKLVEGSRDPNTTTPGQTPPPAPTGAGSGAGSV